MYVCMYVPGYNFGYYVDEFWVFWVFWRIFFGYTGIPLPPPPTPPLADPDFNVLHDVNQNY